MKRLFISVYSLKERCLQIVRRLVPLNSVDSLDIPQILKSELSQRPPSIGRQGASNQATNQS